MHTVFAMAGKDLRLLLRDKMGFFFTFFFPVMYASFFGLMFGGQDNGLAQGIQITLVDEDKTEDSRAFIRKLDESDELDVDQADRAAAEDLVRRGRRVAFVVLPDGFGRQYTQPFADGLPVLETGIDPSRRAEAAMLEGLLTAHLYEGFQQLFSDGERMRNMVDQILVAIEQNEDGDPVMAMALRVFLPALSTFVDSVNKSSASSFGFPTASFQPHDVHRTRKGPQSSFAVSFPQGVVWGMMSCAAAFGISLVVERTHGTLVRLRVAPIAASQILLGKGLACFVVTAGVGALLMVFARVVFGVVPDSVPLLAVALFCSAVCFVGIMMFLSVLGKTEQAAGGIGWAILMVMAMIGGGMIPYFLMPSWMKTVSHVSPVKWTIYSLEGAIWRGFSPAEMAIPCAILLGIGAVMFAIGARAFRWTNR